MKSRTLSLSFGAAALALAAGAGPLPVAPANADVCNDIEVVFARGTGEDPGIGRVGDAFVNNLGGMVGGRSGRSRATPSGRHGAGGRGGKQTLPAGKAAGGPAALPGSRMRR